MSGFGNELKIWRKARRLSQLDLALEADVSARHISFLETGRARPSRDMIARLGTALTLPLGTHNQMLIKAGFAAQFPARRWGDQDMAPIRAALTHMLDRHAPYPGFAVDRLWTLTQLNRPAARLFGALGLGEGTSLIDALCSGDLQPHIVNWPEVAAHAAQRLRLESAAQGGIAELDRAVDILAKAPRPERAGFGPVVPTIYRAGGTELSLFSTIAQFGTPEDVTLEDMRVELFFPADRATETALKTLDENP